MLHNTGIDSDTTPLSATGPQPVWMTLNEARERAFTGELVFEVDPEVLAYLDNGVVYYAERTSDLSLGRRLLDAGLLDTTQLERGTVRVGDVEHLGRLFDRDPSVDRDAVLVMTEAATEELIAEMATHAIATVRTTAYRHHPSGVHRWFVTPLETANPSHSRSALAGLDPTVADDLSGMPGSVTGFEELTIEWDEPFDGVETLDEHEFESSMLEMLADGASPTGTFGNSPRREGNETAAGIAAPHDVGGCDFAIRWTDGSDEMPGEVDAIDDVVSSAPADEPTFADDYTFAMPMLTLDDDVDVAADDVPDDVAEAVRRAIAAIESASTATPSLAQPSVAAPIIVSTVEPLVDDAPTAEASVTSPASFVNAFAPPSLATSAEVLYAQLDDDLNEDIEDDVAETPAVEPVTPTLVEGVDDAAGNERSSALRRLIGGLRRKDR